MDSIAIALIWVCPNPLQNDLTGNFTLAKTQEYWHWRLNFDGAFVIGRGLLSGNFNLQTNSAVVEFFLVTFMISLDSGNGQ